MNIKKLLFMAFTLVLSVNSHALENPKSMYVAIASSGPGGALLGHSYMMFCPDQYELKFKSCEAYEYNLEMNIGHNPINLKDKSLTEKIETFINSPFRIYKHESVLRLQQKYNDRDQKITYYRYSGSPHNIKRIFDNLLIEKRDRELHDYNDYEISDNNCATKIVEAIEHSGDKITLFNNRSFFDFDQYFYNFPIVLEKSVLRSGLFDTGIEVLNQHMRSFSLKKRD